MREGEDEEAVTVDTRALIDKVLARYSGEWTTLRELVQNAADAQATTVRVKWETMPSTSVALPSAPSRSDMLKHVITNHTLRRLVVQNDGQPFTKTDWSRLKRIAEGNPDETKIGAFGVGFYSVFADCEEPFVSSGDEAMAFYWKGNALFTKRMVLPESQRTRDTAFVLDYRNSTTPLPNLLSVGQFLATSLTFVALQQIEFWIDDHKVLALHKKSSPSVEVPIPRDLETRTRDGLMTVNTVDRTSTQIDASFMGAIGWKPHAPAAKQNDTYGAGGGEVPSLRSFFSRLTSGASQAGLRGKAHKEEAAAQEAIAEDVTKLSTSSIFLRVTSASIKTKVSTSFATELERATKKPPPKTTKIAILTSSYDEAQATESSSSDPISKSADVFASVLPSKKPGGRIFIGFPTTQTTGAGTHVSAPSVIPTVEREAIDLNARWVRSWNIEMLRAAGIMTRLAFANEMSDLDAKLQRSVEKGAKVSAKEIAKYMPEAMHILKTFTFSDSTPSGQVAQIIEEAFWTSFRRASIEVYSSRGVLQTSKVRIGSEQMSKFVNSIPVVPPELENDPFMKKLIDFGLINAITVDDVRAELETKALNREQLINFISWAGAKALTGELDPPSKSRLLDVAVATVSEDGSDQGEIITLGSITNYMMTNKIPTYVPIPPSTIPHAFTATCSTQELQALGWQPLEIVPWLRFLLTSLSEKPDDQNVTKTPKFATQVLTVLSKAWDNLNPKSKDTVITLLQAHTVVPTKMGMRKPAESFFPSVKLFDDLPIITCPNLKEKFLLSMGVRKTVDLDTIFTRLLSPSAEGGEKRWSHVELIKYLASVKDDIPFADMKKLRESRICPAEAGPKGLEPTKGTTKLFKVCELFEPKDTLRALGLPLLQWPGPPGSFRTASPEGRFLAVLGLRPYPSAPELVDMMSSRDDELRVQSMTYFIANHHINGYGSFHLATSDRAFLPVEGKEKSLVSPSACFTNPAASILGFDILKADLHVHANKFGVMKEPPISECVSRLLSRPPPNHAMATKLFEYFAVRIGDLGGNSLSRLREAPIVPVVRQHQNDAQRSEKHSSSRGSVEHVSPQRCYLGSSATYGNIFDFVDFGSNANAFLFKCGAKTEPTKTEIAQLACSEPARLLSILQSPDKYMALLKSLAESLPTLKRDKELFRKMKAAPFLLAAREISVPTKEKLVDVEDDDDAPIKQYQLATANHIVILDDIISYRLFKDQLITAPEEEVLEDFYLALGAHNLSGLVKEEVRIGSHVEKQERAVSLRKHLLERSKIFLHEYANYRRDLVKHDAKWLEKNLTVEIVRSVALRRSLKGHSQSHQEKRSAASAQSSSGWVLYIAAEGQPDMYQVGQAICQLILTRPNQQAYFFFEPFLSLDLLGLRARGYNVDRILRAKAAEARIADEERRKALEAEQKRIREREQEWGQKSEAAEAARQAVMTPEPATPSMPGSFGNDSPDDANKQAAPQQPSQRSKGLFSNLTRRLGFESNDNETHDHLQRLPEKPSNSGQQQLAPPPSLPQSQLQQQGDGRSGHSKDDGRVTSPAAVEQNLLNAINSTRSHDSSELFSPPQMNEVKEQATYCDSTSAKNLAFAAEASNGIKVFVARDVIASAGDPGRFLSSHAGAINAFAALLVEVGSGVYSLSPGVLHVFYDEKGGTIAFNSNGSIFCNLRFFLQLHAGRIERGEDKAEAAVWWWVVMAHELAHNLVQSHDSDHSYYTYVEISPLWGERKTMATTLRGDCCERDTDICFLDCRESFIQQYFAKMMTKTAQWKGSGPGPSRESSSKPKPHS